MKGSLRVSRSEHVSLRRRNDFGIAAEGANAPRAEERAAMGTGIFLDETVARGT